MCLLLSSAFLSLRFLVFYIFSFITSFSCFFILSSFYNRLPLIAFFPSPTLLSRNYLDLVLLLFFYIFIFQPISSSNCIFFPSPSFIYYFYPSFSYYLDLVFLFFLSFNLFLPQIASFFISNLLHFTLLSRTTSTSFSFSYTFIL